jgi:hypothetical protein
MPVTLEDYESTFLICYADVLISPLINVKRPPGEGVCLLLVNTKITIIRRKPNYGTGE